MKRKLAMFLSVFLLVAVLMPFHAFAEGDKGLENAIKIAKEKFSIPAGFTQFNYNIDDEGDKKIWSLDWNSKDEGEGRVGVSVDENGNITRYNFYKPFDYNQRNKLPKLSKQDAKAKAEEFIKKVNPDLLSQVKLVENGRIPLMEFTYNFQFMRTVNGIPFPANNLNIEVNRDTGEVQNYYSNWTDNLVFPSADKVIPLQKAQQAFKEKLGLRLIYGSFYDGEKSKINTVYVPKYSGSAIDALTGEKVNTENDYYGPYYGDMGRMGPANFSAGSSAKTEQAALSAEELKAVEQVANLLSKEEAEKKARGIKELQLTSEFTLSNTNLFKDWSNPDDFIWDLYFKKEAKDKKQDYMSCSVGINAKTGEIKRFYIGNPYNPESKPKYDEKASKEIAEKFLKEFQGARFSDVELDEGSRRYFMPEMGNEPSREYNFRYIRKVNSAYFPGNSMEVRINTTNGQVISFDMNWSNPEFPAVDKVISLDTAYEKMFAAVGLELQYKTDYPREYYLKFKSKFEESNKKPEVKLVYALKNGEPAMLEANTGVHLNYNGMPYKEEKEAVYTDIAGNFAEKQIKVLAEYGVTLDGSEFKPNESISQKDFLVLLSKASNYYFFDAYPGVMPLTGKRIEDMYKYLMREGIVKEGEKAPDAPVTNEDGVKYIIRSMKIDKVADLKGIYNCNFKDADKIHPDLIGYAVIAGGMKIIDIRDGYFNPKDKMSRAQAAVMIYNYLQR